MKLRKIYELTNKKKRETKDSVSNVVDLTSSWWLIIRKLLPCLNGQLVPFG
jgi:hypothetical protein